ncbi:MAG: hypothetical protein JSR54_03285 [Proteobacteria bacterium]|nr:hypothetical protein [Pseudomonadota bacterium]
MWRRLWAGAADLAGQWLRRADLRRRARLLRVIERDIVPRLVISTGVATGRGDRPEPRQRLLTPHDVAEFSRLLIEHDANVARAFISALREDGATLEDLYLELLAPAARQLEQLSRAGQADLGELVVAHSRLHSVLNELVTATPAGTGGER